MANKADTEIETEIEPTPRLKPQHIRFAAPTENDDVCCGLILRQIEYEWVNCPFCGEDLPDWAVFSDVVLLKGCD